MKIFKKLVNIVLLFSLFVPYLNFPIRAQAQATFSVQVVGTTNTQAVIKYISPDNNACKVEVSESSNYFPLVHDVNPSLFSGANMDTRTEALSNSNQRIFVIGKRMVEKGIDGKNYSRALQTNTTHYYRVTCGASVVTGTFTTASIPFGMTYSDDIQKNPEDRKGYMYPTIDKTDRNFKFVDPRTGVLHKNMALVSDGSLAYDGSSFGWSSAGFHEWCSPVLSANGFYRCALINDWAPLLYAIHPQTGEVRYLGGLYYWGQSYGLKDGVVGCGNINGVAWDTQDSNALYCHGYDKGGELVVVKMNYTGNDQSVAPGLSGGFPTRAPSTISNLTPAPNTLSKQIRDFDPDFDSSKFNCGIGGSNLGGYIGFSCSRGIQDSFAWIGAFSLQTKTVTAFIPMYAQPKSRWCTSHTGEFLGPEPVIAVHTQFTKGGVGAGRYIVKLADSLPGGVAAGSLSTVRVTSAWDASWGAQPAGFEPGEPVSDELDHYLMDAEVGDLFAVGGEYVQITEKRSATEWVVRRGIGKDQTYLYPRSHSAGTGMVAFCNAAIYDPSGAPAQNPGDIPVIFWNFTQSPRGENPYHYGSNFGSHPVNRGGKRVDSGRFSNVTPTNPATWTLSPSGYVNLSPKFAGAHLPASGNYFEKHSSMPYHGASWFLDMHPYTGGNLATQENDSATKSLGGSLYQYFYNGLDTPHYGGDGINRKQAATFAFNGNYQMVDISGPGSIIGTGSEYNYTYCVANKAGECVAGSVKGDVYFNTPNLTPGHRYCSGNEFYDGSLNVCIGDVPTIGFSVTQNKFQNDNTGQSIRVLSKVFAYAHQSGTANVKVLPDGSWAIMNSYLPGNPIFLVKIPPIPASDGVDRTTFVRAPLTLTPPSGKGITQAKVYFGYSEQGNPGDYYCTSRREACVSTVSAITDSNPFSYAVSDSYSNMPCTTSCTVTVPVLPMRTAYFKVSYLNASGAEVATDNGVIAERYAASIGGASTNNTFTNPSPTPTNPTPTPINPTPPPVIDTTPPVISNVNTSNITTTSATVTWNTNEPSSSQIEYGLTSAYGAISAVDGTLTTNHTMIFSGLSPNTRYHFRVISEDDAGNEAISSKYTFTTQAESVVDNNQPNNNNAGSGARPEWGSVKKITIQASKVSGSLSDFPVLVSFTDPDLKSISDGGKVAKNDGSDILFTSENNDKLSHEIEKYDPGTGELIAWVKLPSISSSVDTVLNLYFGNSSSPNQQDATGVWGSNYVSVWHMGDSDSYSLNDSKNVNNANGTGTILSGTGKIGYGFETDGGSNNYANSTTINFPSGADVMTMSYWVRFDTGPGAWTTILGYGTGGYMSQFLPSYYWTIPEHVTFAGGGAYKSIEAPSTSWKYYTLQIRTGGQWSVYSNGAHVKTECMASCDGWNMTTGTMQFSGWQSLNGVLDEVRISNVLRSADWIATEYNNQSDPSSFIKIGATQKNTSSPVETPPSKASKADSNTNPSVTAKNEAASGSSSGGGGSSSSRAATAKSDNVTNQTTITTNVSGISLPRDLVFGSRGDDVVLLQKTLISLGYLSSDSATGYFGPLTLSAVKKYQQDKDIAGSGDRGWGNVGPQTRAHFANLSSITTSNSLTLAQKAAIQAQINALLSLVTKLIQQLQTLQAAGR